MRRHVNRRKLHHHLRLRGHKHLLPRHVRRRYYVCDAAIIIIALAAVPTPVIPRIVPASLRLMMLVPAAPSLGFHVVLIAFALRDLFLQWLDLLLVLPLPVLDVVDLSLDEEALETHQDLLVHEQTPGGRVQTEVKEVIITVVLAHLRFHILVVLINHNLDL